MAVRGLDAGGGRVRAAQATAVSAHAPCSPASWLAEFGIDENCDLVLVSAGSRKILVINALRTLTGMRLREAEDLVDKAPGLVMHQVTSERADRAKELLESLGATVAVGSDPGQA